MERYKNEICSRCINNKCSNNIISIKKGSLTIMRCTDYEANKTDKNKFLSKYINELKLRKKKNDY